MAAQEKNHEQRERIENLRAQMEAVAQAEAAPQPETPPDPDPAFVHECLHTEERGDGMLFAELHRGKFVAVKNWGRDGTWLEWAGHHWREDKKTNAHNAVENVAQVYLRYGQAQKERIDAARQELAAAEMSKKEAAGVSAEAAQSADEERKRCLSTLAALNREKKLIQNRVDRLRRMSGATNCLNWAHRIGGQSLAILGDDIDLHPWLLACTNGVLDLRTGQFSPGRPDDYLLRATAVPWQGIDAPCPTWDAFINEIHLGDQAVIAYLDRLFGYCLTGLSVEHFIGCFLGEGRNGKGTLFETLKALMGDLGWSIKSELLMENKVGRPTAGPSPDLFDLQGKRLVIASESNKNAKISLSMVKTLTGGDTINARRPYDTTETNFKPTWKLFLYTNHVPSNIAEDFAMRQRLIYINYPLQFVDHPDPSDPMQRPRDPYLPKKLLDELPGILARYVRGCLEWQKDGCLNPPESIRQNVSELAKGQDLLLAWFCDCCVVDPNAFCTVAELGESLETYYNDEVGGKWPPSRKALSQWLTKRGFERRRPGGTSTFHGLRLRTDLL